MAWSTWVQLCGGFAVECGGVRVDRRLPGRQGRLALAFLVIHENRWVSRDELSFAVWGDDEPADAEAGLSSLVSKVRRVVGHDLVAGRSSLRFVHDPTTTYVDAHYARDALHRAQAHLAAGEHRMAWQPAHTAYAIANRGFMAGFSAPWVDEMRPAMETVCLNALECEIRCLLGVDDLPGAEQAARLLVERAPFRESGYALLMSALERGGNRAEALLVFDRLRRLLVEELGASPGTEVSRVHQRLISG